ncbi:MAG: DUF4279 domain-containing protein [Aeromicrobium sp.]|nr:DUF4279 domain-containing protein [Burkholderiales bacterium]
MAALHRAVASLNLSGDDLNPEKITEMLGAKPSRAWRKGDDIRMRPDLAPKFARQGHWSKRATPTEPENLDAQVIELLDGLTKDIRVWQQLSEQFRISVFCGWFMSDANEGVEIAPSTLLLLGERGIRLDLDIYSPDDDA